MMNKVIDYEILEAIDPSGLTPMVKSAMDSGWVPSGPLMHADNFMQVMIKFGSEKIV